MSKIRIPKQVFDKIKDFADKRGIPVNDAVKMFVEASRARVIGAGPVDYEMPDPPTYMSTGEGNMPQIEPVQHGEGDDFDDLANEREQALADGGGDDLAREVIFQRNYRNRLAKTPLISGNPASALQSLMGSTQTVHSGTGTAGGATAPTVARWAADSDAETRPVGVTFGMAPVDPHFGTADVKPFGIVQFGTTGALLQAEVDIGTGCRFSVEASQVILQVGVDSAVAPATACDLILSGLLSFGMVSKPTPMTRTVYIDNLGAGASTSGIPIKPFAKSVQFWRAPVTEAVTIEFHNSALQLLYSFVLAANATMTDPIPISNDCTQIVINDTGAGGLTHGRLIFNLSF